MILSVMIMLKGVIYMDEKVFKFLEGKKREKFERKEKEKRDTLIRLGLYEKEYAPDRTVDSDEYPNAEYDPALQINVYYKMIVPDITDEEFEEIKEYTEEESSSSNVVSSILKYIAFSIYIGGFIIGLINGNAEVEGYYRDYTEFHLEIAMTYWENAFINGTIFLGFSEVIKLLDAIKRKLK